MQTVRTTITLPADLHEELLLRAFIEKKSLGTLISESLIDRSEKNVKHKLSDKFQESNLLLKRLKKKLGNKEVNWTKIVRDMRDKRAEHLSKFI